MTARQKRGCLLVALGLCMVFASLWLHRTQERQDALAGENAAVLLHQLQTDHAPPSLPDPAQPEAMAEKAYLDYTVIGTLRIADLGMELPILSTWSEEWLYVSPCRFSGSLAGKDLILMGHNFKSHFTPLHRITVGTGVEFEDVGGKTHRYAVAELEILYKNDIEKLPSAYPLTLFTCTSGGENRLIVRCIELSGQ